MIVGIDEVGRGSWAGPVVVAAVGLGDEAVDGLTDSKVLSKKKRETLSAIIKRNASKIGIGWVSADNIDRIGMSAALKRAAAIALGQIDDRSVDQIIIDGTIRLIDDPRVTCLPKADMLVPSVSAASIIAKVARDEYMTQCSQVFSDYGFEKHVGYGVAVHRQALSEFGVCPLHRLSFSPMSQLARQTIKDKTTNQRRSNATSPTAVGKNAEQCAASYLTSRRYTVVEQNWKTKWCEIDIVALNGDNLVFFEVKYRRSLRQGGGLAAITPRKLRQMKFAAELWLVSHQTTANPTLGAIEVLSTGDTYTVGTVIDDIIL